MEIFKNTGIGIVEKRGNQVRDVVKGDRVVWIGIPSSDKVIIPEYLFEKIPEDLENKIGIFGGIGAYIIQAVRESGLTFGEKVVVLGHGVIKNIISQIIDLFGIHTLELDNSPKDNIELDGVFICSGGEANINLIANSIRNKAVIIILTEGHIDLPIELLEKKRIKIIKFPVEFQKNTKNVYYPKAYSRWTIKEDLKLFLMLQQMSNVTII